MKFSLGRSGLYLLSHAPTLNSAWTWGCTVINRTWRMLSGVRIWSSLISWIRADPRLWNLSLLRLNSFLRVFTLSLSWYSLLTFLLRGRIDCILTFVLIQIFDMWLLFLSLDQHSWPNVIRMHDVWRLNILLTLFEGCFSVRIAFWVFILKRQLRVIVLVLNVHLHFR